MKDAVISFVPNFAPLNQPMVLRLLEQTKPFPSSQEHWNTLFQTVYEKRSQVYQFMQMPVEQQALSTHWLMQALAHFDPSASSPPSAETISRWREGGLIRYIEVNHPDAHSAASLLTFRALVKRSKGWMPKIEKDEAPWWCWRQDTPHSPIVPCPIPVPDTLPRSTLLWTPWTGATWDPYWLAIPGLGAARWASLEKGEDQVVRWGLTEAEMQLWGGQHMRSSTRRLSVLQAIRHEMGNLLLLSLASERLEQMPLKRAM